MKAKLRGRLRSADFELDLDRSELYHRGTKVAVQRKPLEVLGELMLRGERTVAKAELLARVWPGVRVSDHALVSAIRDLRRALGDTESPHKVVVTDRGRGFRFAGRAVEVATVGKVSIVDEGPVRDAVRLRIGACSTACNRLLRIASVVGRELQVGPLARACGLSHGDTHDLLEEAASADLLSRVAGSRESYCFAHELVRQTLYRDIGPSERVRMHRKIAEALEQLADASERHGEIVFHYTERAADGVAEMAVAYAMSAAQRAIALMALDDVVSHYGRALHALALVSSPDPELRSRLLLLQTEAARAKRRHVFRTELGAP